MRSGLAARAGRRWRFSCACVETFAAETPAAPSPAPSVPPTLWSFLGLKQCVDKCKKQIVLHKEKKAENQAVQGGHSCLKHLFGPLCPCGCLKCEILKKKAAGETAGGPRQSPIAESGDQGGGRNQDGRGLGSPEGQSDSLSGDHRLRVLSAGQASVAGGSGRLHRGSPLRGGFRLLPLGAAIPARCAIPVRVATPTVRKKLSDLAGGAR